MERSTAYAKLVDLTVVEHDILPLIQDVPLSRRVEAHRAFASLLHQAGREGAARQALVALRDACNQS